jgi:hypothetical protein
MSMEKNEQLNAVDSGSLVAKNRRTTCDKK